MVKFSSPHCRMFLAAAHWWKSTSCFIHGRRPSAMKICLWSAFGGTAFDPDLLLESVHLWVVGAWVPLADGSHQVVGLIRSTSFVGKGGNPSLMTVELPLVDWAGRSSSAREPNEGSDGPVDRSGSTGKWNPAVPTPVKVAVHLNQENIAGQTKDPLSLGG